MKQHKDALWEKLPNALGAGPKDMNANEILGKDITMKVAGGGEPGESKKAGKGTGPTTETGVGAKGMEKGPYEKELKTVKPGGASEKLSPMAQSVGAPRKGR